ncbi:hypothetical protein BY996DRAFT_8501638 [Phakopsora pachyrhizi]|nr:hypothetical protein BY996DRAFT_8501638 [Phakopsora pachyrhizi]
MVLKAFNMLTLTATWLQHYGDKMLPMTKAIARMTDKDVGWPLPDTTDKEMIATLLETLPRIRAAFSPTQAALRTKNLEFIEDQLSPVITSSSIGLGSQATTLSLLNKKQDLFRSRADTFSSHDQTTTINSNYTTASANSSPFISVHSQNKLASDQKAEYKLLQDFAQQLMGNTEDMIALQITRLEWDIFAEMTPRHLIRHILAPRDPKHPRAALRDPSSPIACSTNFLNHLAGW